MNDIQEFSFLKREDDEDDYRFQVRRHTVQNGLSIKL